MKSPILLGLAVFGLSACATSPDRAPQSVPAIETGDVTDPNPAQTKKVVESFQAADTTTTPAIFEPSKPTENGPKPLSKKFKTLVYGLEKELVCTKPFLAEGKLKNRPNLQLMWENYLYPRPEGIWGEIGGMVEVNGNLPMDQGRWTNACAVRLSYMLNKAGQKIPRDDNNKTVSGGNKDQYYYRLNDLIAYLTEIYGEPDIDIDDGTGNSFDLPITPGVVIMDFPDNSFTGHATVWNGAGTVDGAEIGGYRVLFWDLPCFVPKDRKTSTGQTPKSP